MAQHTAYSDISEEEEMEPVMEQFSLHPPLLQRTRQEDDQQKPGDVEDRMDDWDWVELERRRDSQAPGRRKWNMMATWRREVPGLAILDTGLGSDLDVIADLINLNQLIS